MIHIFIRIITTITLVFLSWETIAALTRLPHGDKVIRTLFELVTQGYLLRDILASSFRWGSGFIVGAILGILLALITALPRHNKLMLIARSVESGLHLARAIPVIGLPTILIFIAGFAEWGKMFIIGWGCAFPVWLSTHRGIQSIDEELYYISRCLQMSWFRRLIHIVIPAISHPVFSGLRISLGVGWICVVAAEWIGVYERGWLGYGLGIRLWREQELNHLAACSAILLCFGLLGLVTDTLFALSMRTLVPRFLGFDPNR